MAVHRELSDEQIARLKELYDQLPIAIADAGERLAKDGMQSESFRAADQKSGQIMEEINRLIGRKSWMG